jgi:hypothetical protein
VLWITTKVVAGFSNFGSFDWIVTKENAHSRNSGKCGVVVEKFCGGPEILDQILFRSYENAAHVPKYLKSLLWITTKVVAGCSNFGSFAWIVTKESECSRKSGISGVLLQKFCGSTENLDQILFRSYILRNLTGTCTCYDD